MGQKSADIWSLSGLWAKSLQIFNTERIMDQKSVV